MKAVGVKVAKILKSSCGTGVVLSLVAALSSCTELSKEGPTASSIRNQAALKVGSTSTRSIFDYVLVNVDDKVVNQFGKLHRPSLYGTFGNVKSTPSQIRLGVGDVVQITIFEAQSGGLFIPTEAGARPGNFVTLPT